MNVFNNILASISFFSEDGLNNVPITGITKLVKILIETFSIGGLIAVGIILFTLVLKVLPLPLDIYSRAATKKNALKMEKMRPQLEKLQKQYANNKQLYTQKMMALYKKEGYSTFAACLPTLFTLVFFIMVITAFNKYSTYANLNTFNEMAKAYNAGIVEQVNETDDLEIVLNDEVITGYKTGATVRFKTDSTLTDDEKNALSEKIVKAAQDKAADCYFEESKKMKFIWVKNIWIPDLPWKKAFVSESDYNSLFTYSKGMFKRATIDSDIKGKENYELLTGSDKLKDVKNQPNGYLGLVIISIASMLVQQIIMTKSQKAQMELQSVDGANGQAATTAKMMTWMMPIMFGVFSFMYSGAFSLYLIVSTLFSLATTTIINLIVEKLFVKKAMQEEEEKQKARFKHLNKDE